MTAPYHPSSNMVERFHRTLGEYLRAYTAREQAEWHKHLKFAVFTYNNTVNSATGFTANELVFGHTIELPLPVTNGRMSYDYGSYKREVQEQIRANLDLTKRNLEERKEKNKKNFDKTAKTPLQLEKNDLVLVRNETMKSKWDKPYHGPYRVADVQSPAITIIKKKNQTVPYHNDKLKKATADYGDRTPPPINDQVANPRKRIFTITRILPPWTILLLTFLLALIGSNALLFNATTPNPGAILNRMNTVKISHDQYQLCYAFDLKSYYDDLDKFYEAARQMRNYCLQVANGDSCISTLLQVEKQATELEQELNEITQTHGRIKRAPLEILGWGLKTLTGVMDADSAREYDAQLKRTNENAQQTDRIVNQNTMLIKRTIDITQKSHAELRNNLLALGQQIDKMKNELAHDINEITMGNKVRDAV